MKKLFLAFVIGTLIYPLSAYEVHSWDGSAYSKNSDSQKRTADYILDRFKFDGNEKILDLGCGEGKIAANLSALVPQGQIVGLDLSSSMIGFAEKNFPSEQFPNLDFMIGNATELHFEKEFDLIFSFTSLQWVQDHDKTLQGMHQSLKAGGTIALAMPLGLPLSIEQSIQELIHQEKWRDYFKDFKTGFNFVDPPLYKKMVESNRFQISHFEQHPQKDFFPSKDALSGFMSQWLPYLRPLPDSLKESFMSEMLDRYFELEEIDPNGSVYFYPTHLVVIAHKI